MTTTTRHGSAVVTLPSDCEILITRQFDVPAEILFDVFTKPEHVRHWFGAGPEPMPVCEIDLRVGGSWCYVHLMDDGSEHAFSGTYLEIERPTRLVTTWRYEPFPDAESVETMTLEEHDGVTKFTNLVRHTSKENRDGHLNAGMEGGMQKSLDVLEDIALSLL